MEPYFRLEARWRTYFHRNAFTMVAMHIVSCFSILDAIKLSDLAFNAH